MENPTTWEEDFMDFYFERGKYQGRKLGPEQYINFISTIRKEAYLDGKRDGLMEEAEHTENYIKEAAEQTVKEILNLYKIEDVTDLHKKEIRRWAKSKGIDL